MFKKKYDDEILQKALRAEQRANFFNNLITFGSGLLDLEFDLCFLDNSQQRSHYKIIKIQLVT